MTTENGTTNTPRKFQSITGALDLYALTHNVDPRTMSRDKAELIAGVVHSVLGCVPSQIKALGALMAAQDGGAGWLDEKDIHQLGTLLDDMSATVIKANNWHIYCEDVLQAPSAKPSEGQTDPTLENRLHSLQVRLDLARSHTYPSILSACDGLQGSSDIIHAHNEGESSCSSLDINRLISGQSAFAELIIRQSESLDCALKSAQELTREIQSQQKAAA